MAFNKYDVNDPVKLSVTFSVAAVDTDPTAVVLKVKDPAGTTVTYNWPTPATITKDATGKFSKQVTVTLDGRWLYRWEGTGTAAGAEEGTFGVRQQLVT